MTPPTRPDAPASSGQPPHRKPMADHDLRDPASYLAPTDECDLIMKGGITSGLVYPMAASRLATRYRFRSIGGASAGAIAAALTAAAEYQRRAALAHPPEDTTAAAPAMTPGTGFLSLVDIPAELGPRLPTLFQPSAAMRRPYETAMAAVSPRVSTAGKVAGVVRHAVSGAPGPFALVTAAALGVGLVLGVIGGMLTGDLGWRTVVVSLLAALPFALLLGVAAAAVRLVRDTLEGLPRNGFGMVRGLRESPDGPPPLTDWLTERLDRAAGLLPEQGPLTFGHLYGPEASDVFRRLKLDEYDAPDSPTTLREFEPIIDLQMMTTCLSLGRPFVFPLRTKVFTFCPDCWRDWFPARVVDHLVRTSTEPPVVTQTVHGRLQPVDQTCPDHPGVAVRRLPPAPDMPVVVGVRISLSFPGLISGVPFWTIDFDRAEGHRGLVKVWFSDGGIVSNFPIHFFDTLLPGRPTFGINLGEPHPDQPDALTFRPRTNLSGILQRVRPITSMGAFLGAVWTSAQNWADNLAITAPGFRDRVVELRLREAEGGLNIDMPPEIIAELGRRGDQAAQELEDFDFANHRWVRYRTAMGALSELLDRFDQGWPAYRDFVAGYDGRAYAFRSRATRTADLEASEQLETTVTHWIDKGYPATRGPLPNPRPYLRPTLRR